MDMLSTLPDVPLARITAQLSVCDMCRLAGASPVLWHRRELLLNAVFPLSREPVCVAEKAAGEQLCKAARVGNVMLLRWFHNKLQLLCDTFERYEKDALRRACRAGKVEAALYLACVTSPGCRADGLIEAADKSQLAVVQALLAEGDEPPGGDEESGHDAFYPTGTFSRSLNRVCVSLDVLGYRKWKADPIVAERRAAVMELLLRKIFANAGASLPVERVRFLKMAAFSCARWSNDKGLMRLLLSSAKVDGGVGITAIDVHESPVFHPDGEMSLFFGLFFRRPVADLRVLFRPAAQGGVGFTLVSDDDRRSALRALHAVFKRRRPRDSSPVSALNSRLPGIAPPIVEQTAQIADALRFWLAPEEAGGPGLTAAEVRKTDALLWASYYCVDIVKLLLTPRIDGGVGLSAHGDAAWLTEDTVAVVANRYSKDDHHSFTERHTIRESCKVVVEAMKRESGGSVLL